MSNQPAPSTPPLPVQVWGDTHRGQVRDVNEDSFYCPTKQTQGYKQIDQNTLGSKGYLLIVADGIGGSDLGQRASREVVQSLRDIYYESPVAGTPDQRLGNAVQYANDHLYQMRTRNPALGQAGSTVVAAVVQNNTLYLANAGDSRAYLVRNGQAFQRSTDHTVIAEKRARNQPVSDADQSVITRSMGEKLVMPADVYIPTSLEDGDAILLCSDGLSDVVNDQDLAKIVTANSPRAAVQKLIRQANRAGGPDNITTVVAKIGQAKAMGGGFSLKTLSQRQKTWLGIAFVIGVVFWALLLLVINQSSAGGTTPTASPAAPAIAAPTDTPLSGGMIAPTAATTAKPTSTLRPTPVLTDTPVVKTKATDASATPSVTPLDPTVSPSGTPTGTLPSCPDNQYWDPVMNRCRGLGSPPIEPTRPPK